MNTTQEGNKTKTWYVAHCHAAWINYEFMATTCEQYRKSSIDRVFAMGTYGGSINGPEEIMKFWHFKEIVQAGAKGIGTPKYSVGIRKNFPYCANASTCVFDESAKQNIDW